MQDLETSENQNTVDPFSIAAKYSLEFVSTRPFQDGNGRLCRMILNAILCRYAGIIIPIGEQGEERDEYMGIKKRASLQMGGQGVYATWVIRPSSNISSYLLPMGRPLRALMMWPFLIGGVGFSEEVLTSPMLYGTI